MIRLMFAAVALFAAVTASAQTVERTINLSALGWGNITATPVDTDGIPQTEEWIVRNTDTSQWRVIAIRNGGMCIGAWFDPRPNSYYGAVVSTVGGRSKLLVTRAFDPSAPLIVVGLTTPSC